MKARSKHTQLQRYTRNWATHEIMKTLIKNKRSYKKRIMSEDDDRKSFMKDGEELEGDDDERRDEDEEGNEEENGDDYEEFERDGDERRDEDEEGNEEENGEGEGTDDDGEGNADEGFGEDMYIEEGENAEKEGNASFQGSGDEDDVDDRSAVGQRKGAYAWDLEWEAATGFGATTSQSAATKKSKKSAATSKSVGKLKFKPAAVGFAGMKRKVPEDEDHGIDQVAAVTGRRNPARNIREPKKLRL
jgi:hypothetical protein